MASHSNGQQAIVWLQRDSVQVLKMASIGGPVHGDECQFHAKTKRSASAICELCLLKKNNNNGSLLLHTFVFNHLLQYFMVFAVYPKT